MLSGRAVLKIGACIVNETLVYWPAKAQSSLPVALGERERIIGRLTVACTDTQLHAFPKWSSLQQSPVAQQPHNEAGRGCRIIA